MRSSATRADMSFLRPSTRRHPSSSQIASAIARRVGRLAARARTTSISDAEKSRPQYRSVAVTVPVRRVAL